MSSGPPPWHEIEALYHAALACDPAERAILLARADPDVRREVSSLLAQNLDDVGLSDPAAFIAATLRGHDREACPPSLSAGTRLGPYEISGLIGAGGMGEVYRATDTSLARDVAIKVLPEAVASDVVRLTRFEREAKTLAALNHPHIAGIYGLETSAGRTARVMELIEGPTLAERIARGPIPIDEALRIAAQIAEALQAAHALSIVHRDLKPANIKVRRDGTVKVLDFGLAKAVMPPEARAHGAPHSPAITTPLMTQAGLILGTAGYASPEQVRGEAVDGRADVWAFGCVLYEMLTGRRAFGAATVTETFARILEGHADLDALPAATPPGIRRLIRRCLDRSPTTRLQHIGDARADIVDVRAGDPALSGIAVSRRGVRYPRAVMWATTAVALAGVFGTGAWFGASRNTSGEPTGDWFSIPRVGDAGPLMSRSLALSPDASRYVYATGSSLRIKPRDGDDVPLLPVAGTDPFFSPDGDWVAFFSRDGLQRIPVGGGAVETITREVVGTERKLGGTWAADGTIVISIGGSLLRIGEDGKTYVIAAPDASAGEVGLAWPEVLPDGRSVLFTILRERVGDARIAVIDLITGQRTMILEGGHGARHLATGHLVYAAGGRLHTVGFDLRSLQPRGVPMPVAGVEIATTTGGFTANFAVSSTGRLAYIPPPAAPRLRTMAWVDRNGREEPIDAPARPYVYPRISPDATRVALDIGGENRDIHVWHFERQTLTKITDGPTEDLMPVWTLDSARVFFGSDRHGGPFRIFSVAADAAGPARPEFAGPHNYMPLSMPAPGELLAFAAGPRTKEGDIARLTLGNDGQAQMLLELPGRQVNAEVSPDRRWIAYESHESGNPTLPEVYVRPYPDVYRTREPISFGGGVQPLWGKAGSNELFYWDLKGTLKVVSLTLGPDLEVGATRDVPLGDGYWVGAPGVAGAGWRYQVSPKDGRLLLFKSVPADAPTPIQVRDEWMTQ